MPTIINYIHHPIHKFERVITNEIQINPEIVTEKRIVEKKIKYISKSVIENVVKEIANKKNTKESSIGNIR